ncbi:hypothetical protein GCM10022631_36380 [Deinococcus rubellus]|uniref:Uncharacterized protein n=1 Tax=Deinococcus rubellus TaxID=1889240 RepID=A0ABY5YJX3_9DEIO|nr:hypothetical protein [Deinococcus rubellus]UWX65389.1 hypothetical protein N0D28_06965 [Deinococcus rubellus]
MTNAVAIALLSSLTLFLGLSALARRHMQRERLSISGLVLTLSGLAGLGWLIMAAGLRAAAPVLLIGALGYCFGHFTTPRRADSRLSAPGPQLKPK